MGIQLAPHGVIDNPKHIAAIARIKAVFMEGTPCSAAISSGKDSSILMDFIFHAARLAIKDGADPFIVVTNGDTGIENSEIAAHARADAIRIKAYAEKHGINLSYHVAKPVLNDTWAVTIISGRKLPSFSNNTADCSINLKVRPMTTLRRKLLKDIVKKTGKEAVSFVGTRLDESVKRNKAMLARGEDYLSPTRNANGELVYPVIADFSSEDVWEWVGLVRSNLVDSYSDFNDLVRLYSDAGNTSCAVIADAILESQKSAKGGCGSRTGCHQCQMTTNDVSLTNMIKSDYERYGYLQGPNNLREFISKTQWDFDRRQWLSRTLDLQNRFVIRPDTYSPEMCLDILRYSLTIDAQEKQAADDLGIAPRFEIVSIEELVAIDALWSLQGWHKPFQAIKEYHDIYVQGMRYSVPDVPRTLRKPMPKPRYLSVPETHLSKVSVFDGLRSPLHELHADSPCMGTRSLSNGKVVLDVETNPSFNVDAEGALMALEFELDRLLEKHQQASSNTGFTRGYHWWVQMGIVSLSPQQISIHDAILQRTCLKESLGLLDNNVTSEQLISMAD